MTYVSFFQSLFSFSTFLRKKTEFIFLLLNFIIPIWRGGGKSVQLRNDKFLSIKKLLGQFVKYRFGFPAERNGDEEGEKQANFRGRMINFEQTYFETVEDYLRNLFVGTKIFSGTFSYFRSCQVRLKVIKSSNQNIVNKI